MKNFKLDRMLALIEGALDQSCGVKPLALHETDLWALARQHKIATLFSKNLVSEELSQKLEQEEKTIWQACALRERAYVKEAYRIEELLKEKNIPICFLKGLWLSENAYPRAGLRVYRDMDFLLAPRDVSQAARALESDGYIHKKSKGPLKNAIVNQGSALIACENGLDSLNFEKGDYFIELHTNILPVSLANVSISMPVPAEVHFVHLCIHATRHHFVFGLRHILDLLVLVRSKKLDWGWIDKWISECDLKHLTWPAQKIASDCFPSDFEKPSDVGIHWITRRYTKQVRRYLLEMPMLSMELEGSPFLFHISGNQKKTMLSMLSKKAFVYQTGLDSESSIHRVKWFILRPYSLLKRHMLVVLRSIYFLLK